MDTQLMQPANQSADRAAPWQWCLPRRAAARLGAQPASRWLAVDAGRVWLTRSQRALEPGDDVWLEAGERWLLPAGSEWVAEGWPEARVSVLMAPPDPAAAGR